MSEADVRKFAWDAIEREDLGSGMSRSAFGTDEAMLVWNFLEPGCGVTEPHSHEFDQFALILQGEVTFTCDGDDHVVSAGEALFIPAGVEHCGLASEDGPAVNLDVFAPAREDLRHLYRWTTS